MHSTAPYYLTEMFTCTPVTDDPGRLRLLSAARGDVVVPRTNIKKLDQRSVAVHGPVLSGTGFRPRVDHGSLF